MTAVACEVMLTYEELLETERLQGETIRLQAAAMAGKDRLIAELKAQIEDLKRQVFGSRSEKLKRQEKEADETENETARTPPQSKAKKDSASRHQGGGRGAFPQDLEVIQIVLDVPESEKFCQETGEPLTFLRNEITRKMEFIPGRWVCHEYVRPMYVRRRDLMAGVMNPVMASLPPQLIPGSDIENGFLAHLIVSKYLDYLPWYRQEQIARRSGVELSRRKLCRWSAEVANLLAPIVLFLIAMLTAAKESTLPQSRTHKAVDYALNRWKELGVFAQPGKGHVELSTNILENKIRPVALNRRNSLFIGHPKAGKKSAIFYSIFATCRLCEVCPEKYLRWLFPKLAVATNQTYPTLLPHAYAAELKAAAAKGEPDG